MCIRDSTYSEINAWIHHAGGQELWDELTDDFGTQSFIAGNTVFKCVDGLIKKLDHPMI